RLSKNPKTAKIGVHNSFIFKRLFSAEMPKLDFFDSLVRCPAVATPAGPAGSRAPVRGNPRHALGLGGPRVPVGPNVRGNRPPRSRFRRLQAATCARG